MATRGQLLWGEQARVERAGYPAGSLGFTWAAIGLAGWLLGGVYLDGWAHIHVPDLETFFTPWHAILYSGFFALFALLTLTAGRNRGRGYAWRRVLPPGYGLSLAGGFIFLVGGVLDLIWHQLFGIEANTEALLSPTHLILATGIALLVTGPVRSAGPLANDLARSGMFAGPSIWVRRLPALLGLTFLLALCGFFTQFAHPLANPRAAADSFSQPPTEPLSTMRAAGAEQTRLILDSGASTFRPIAFTQVTRSGESGGETVDLGLASILLQAALLIGVTLFALRRWPLPFGTLTLVFGFSGILMAVLRDHEQFIPAAVLAGLFADLLLRWLHPTADRPGALRLFAFAAPLVYESLYFATLALTSGIAWSIHLWAGAAVMAGAVGVLLSTLLIPPESAQHLVSASTG